MPAPDLTTLYDFETQIEDNGERILEDALTVGGVSVLQQRNARDLTTPRVELNLRMGAATGNRHIYPNQSAYLNAYNALLICRIVTQRTINGQPDVDSMRLLRAQLRRYMQIASDKFGSTAFPYHVLVKIMEAGTNNSVDEKEDVDVSDLSFSVIVGIRTDAWPVLEG